MNWRLNKIALVALAVVSGITTGWAQTPTPTPATAIYVSDWNAGAILKYDEAGQMTVFASDIGLAGYQTGLAFGTDGYLYAVTGPRGIDKFDVAGNRSEYSGGNLLNNPAGIAFDNNGILYVANFSAENILKIDSTGHQTIFVENCCSSFRPVGVAFNQSGNLYVTTQNGALRKFAPSGNWTFFGNVAASSGLAFDSGGNLYAADWSGHTIAKFDSAGQGTLFAYTSGYPNGIAFDTAGNLYVAETGNNTIEKFDSTGQGSFFASGLGAPYGIAIWPSAIPTHEYISGNISYCSNPSPGPVQNVTLNMSGSTTDLAITDSVGDYQFSSLALGGNYTVTPAKSALLPSSPGINTVDVLATARHYLGIALIPPGCRLTAADVNGDGIVTTVDVIAIQRFFIGRTFGIGDVGKYQFSPASRTYPTLSGDETAQNYDALVFGDVASPFVH